jgi:hypothetical protein
MEMTRRLHDLTLPPDVGPAFDSLAAALTGVLRWCGPDETRSVSERPAAMLDEVAAVAGIAAMFTCAPRQPCPRRWNDYGRHAFLETTARLFGLQLRDLHPPDAAPLPIAPPEFDLHFRDSYLPLIETALSHGQPVLAWMGWPAPAETAWGVITEIDPQERACSGFTAAFGGRKQRLVRACVQVYVVQACEAVGGSETERLDAALRHARAALCNELPSVYGVVNGPEALRHWRARIAEGPLCPACGGDGWQCCQRLARVLAANRSAGRAYFGADYPGASPSLAESARRLAEIFNEEVSAMAPAQDEAYCRDIQSGGPARADLLARIDRLIELEQRAAEALRAIV